ncbi:MAG: hypothetical protein RSG56_09645, partial [Brevundimonas sp.]
GRASRSTEGRAQRTGRHRSRHYRIGFDKIHVTDMGYQRLVINGCFLTLALIDLDPAFASFGLTQEAQRSNAATT